MIVNLPLSGCVSNDAVVHAADCHMSRFLNGDGRTLACLVRRKEPGDETDAVKLTCPGQAAEFDKGRKDVDQADGLGAALPGSSDSGRGYDEGNTRGFLP